jgi:hypothetical protein
MVRENTRFQAYASQRFNGTLENELRIPSDLACGGIENQDRLPIRYDPNIITRREFSS